MIQEAVRFLSKSQVLRVTRQEGLRLKKLSSAAQSTQGAVREHVGVEKQAFDLMP